MPEISVVVINWNKRELLKSCLLSLRAQSFRDFEIIVVDNGSTDGSVESVKTDFPEVKVFSLESNRGFPGANNVGIGEAKGKYIALLNNDAEAEERWLEKMYGVFESRPEIGFCASKMIRYSERERIDSAGLLYLDIGVTIARGEGEEDGVKFKQPLELFGACAGAAMYRKDMLEDIGLFDEDFYPGYYEDADLSFRAQLKGYRCLYVPTAVVYHRGTSTFGFYSKQHIYLCNRNGLYTLIKNMPFSILMKNLIWIILYQIISVCYNLLKLGPSAALMSRFEAMRNLKIVLKKRRIVQAGRVEDKEIERIITPRGFLLKFKSTAGSL